MKLEDKIKKSLIKFKPNLNDKNILTEAATGNYIVTPIIAALSGGNVFALAKNTKYGTVEFIKEQTYALAKKMNLDKQITIIESYNEIDLTKIDILTNTGFNRPITRNIIDKLNPNAVIPLMWEPWEFRPNEIDIEACHKKGIKIYGTNESDYRLQTQLYIGYIVLHFLLANSISPKSGTVLIIGDLHFGKAISTVLKKLEYSFTWNSNYKVGYQEKDYDAIIFAEHQDNTSLVGENGYIKPSQIDKNCLLIHISGNVNFSNIKCKTIPSKPANYGHMSYTADYIDSMAVIDLHCAGLKVAEGMLKANMKNLEKKEYKDFMESNYPALSFENEKYW